MSRKIGRLAVVEGEEFGGNSKPLPRVTQVSNTLRIKPDHLKSFDPLTENQRKFYEAYKKRNRRFTGGREQKKRRS